MSSQNITWYPHCCPYDCWFHIPMVVAYSSHYLLVVVGIFPLYIYNPLKSIEIATEWWPLVISCKPSMTRRQHLVIWQSYEIPMFLGEIPTLLFEASLLMKSPILIRYYHWLNQKDLLLKSQLFWLVKSPCVSVKDGWITVFYMCLLVEAPSFAAWITIHPNFSPLFMVESLC